MSNTLLNDQDSGNEVRNVYWVSQTSCLEEHNERQFGVHGSWRTEAVKPCKGSVCAGQRVCIHLSLALSGTQPCACRKGIRKHWANDLCNPPRELLLTGDKYIHWLSLWEAGTGPLKWFQPNDQATSWVSKFYWNYLLRGHKTLCVVSLQGFKTYQNLAFCLYYHLHFYCLVSFSYFPRFQINFLLYNQQI